MIALLVNDLHVASRGPSTRKDDYHATLTRKLQFVERTAIEHKVDCICIAGDLFHATTLAYQAGEHAPLTNFLDRIKCWRGMWPVLVIPGNHDLPHDRMDLAPQSAFGALYATGFVQGVWEKPWLAGDGWWVGGLSYPATEVDIRRWAAVEGPGILMVHAFASVNGPGEMYGDRIWGYMELAQMAPNVKVWHFGHDHSDKGIVTLGDTHFVQVGALMRGTLAADQVERQPRLVVVKTESAQPLFGWPAVATCIEIPVPIEPAEAVFDLAKRAQVSTVNTQIDAYVQELAAVGAMASPDPAAAVATLDVPPEVRARVEGYLKRASEAA